MPNNALQLYLEQLYRKNAANGYPNSQDYQNANAAAAADANYKVGGHPDSVGTQGHGVQQSNLDKLRAALEGSWAAQGNAGLNLPMGVGTQRHFPGANTYPQQQQANLNQALGQSSIPGGNLTSVIDAKRKAADDAANRRRGELNTREDTITKAREAYRASHPQGAPVSDPLSDIEAQIRALAGRPDIPGHWESAYSQDYLNQLGGRLAGAGSAAQQQFADAKNEIGANYQAGIDQRNAMQGGLVNQLQQNGQNIGVDYGASQQGQQAAQDRAYLSQVAETNKANDLTTNDRLGLLANQFGSNLGMQAREGLLTPKQWIDRQSGLSDGDRAMLGFLQDKYGQQFGAQQDALDRAASAKETSSMLGGFTDFARSLTNTADQDQVQNWPDLVQGLAGITDRRTADEASRIWNITGDPQSAVNYLETKYKEDNPDFFKTINKPVWMPSSAPLGAVGSPAYNASQQQIANYKRALQNYTDDSNQQKQNRAMWEYLLNFFNTYNPNRNPVTTANKMSNSSSEKLSGKS